MDDQEEYLISYANLKSDLFRFQKNFLDPEKLNNFYENNLMGMPLCLPKNIKYFEYKNANFFKIDKKKFSKKIFNTHKTSYIGNLKYFRYGNIFAHGVELKQEYKSKYEFYLNSFKILKKKILLLSKNKKNNCAMQIRNVPHSGHEAVFKYLISKFDYLILNPIFGIKKKNDFSDKLISKALKFMEKKYKNIVFLPVWSNFHYAGPREAIHHMHLREGLGFKFFYVGRDHAGAENLYNTNDSINLVKKFSNFFKIVPFTSLGGYFCKKCKIYLIKGSCNHNKLINISGTEFRKSLRQNLPYKHADLNLQKKIEKFL